MSGHLCLKWNNHSLAFLKSIVNIQTKERYCDATIACQGKYYPVHRIVLSTCSEYFEEIFERIQNPHPYIFFNDIDPGEMELLLNYMYQGEINVIQEQLPVLIKAAEALKIKGLAVPDDKPVTEASSGKRKSSSSGESRHSKRKMEENRKHETKVPGNPGGESDFDSRVESEPSTKNFEQVHIKEELVDSKEEDPRISEHLMVADCQLSQGNDEADLGAALNGQAQNDVSSLYFITEKKPTPENQYEEQSSLWGNFEAGNALQSISNSEMSTQEDIFEMTEELPRTEPNLQVQESIDNETRRLKQYQQCPHCEYGSWNAARVKNHIKFKHTRERPFPCHLCGRRFTMKHHLLDHERVHTGEKPFQCSFCPMRFARKSNVKLHMKRRHKFC